MLLPLFYFLWKAWIGPIIIGLGVLTILAALWGIFIAPPLKQRYWRYDVSEEFIQTEMGSNGRESSINPDDKSTVG